jgi:hypothetical protein
MPGDLRWKWNLRWTLPVLALGVFLLNALLVRRLFGIEYLNQMWSIEAAYISLARYITENWGDLSWFPLWYNGMPFVNTYQPGLPMLSAAASALTGMMPAHAYHVVVALFYCVGPVGLLLLIYRLSANRVVAALAAFIYSVFSPFVVFELFKHWNFGLLGIASRLDALVVYGEGPNVSGLSLVPFALVSIDAVYRKLSPLRFISAAFALGAIVLVSWPASVVLTMGLVAYLLSREKLPHWHRVATLAALAAVSYGLIAPWMPISTILDNQRNSQLIGGNYHYTGRHVVYFGVLAAALAVARFGLRRVRAGATLEFGTYLAMIAGTVAVAGTSWKVALLPQPERFHLAFDIGAAIALAAICIGLMNNRRVRRVVVVALALVLLLQASRYYRFARRVIQPVEITQTFEYTVSRWFAEHMPDQRIFATGSGQFWLNAWSDTPQMGGCCLPGLPNPINWISSYIVPSDDGAEKHPAETSLLWLRAYGAHAVLVNGPKTRDAFLDWTHPTKFEGVLPRLWEAGDDRIYEVPSRTTSLAHVMERSQLVGRAPVNGIDLEPLRGFVAALEDPSLPVATFRWLNRHEASIQAQLRPGQIVSVQETYTRGWRARAEGKDLAVQKDALGLMFVEPGCAGNCEVRLEFDGGGEARVLWWVRLMVAFGVGGWCFWWIRSRSGPTRAA